MKKLTAILVIALLAVFVAACGGGSTPEKDAQNTINDRAEQRTPYIPKNDVEFNNYNKAQELYDSPSTIIWCTAFSQNATAPLVTVPVTGKLTSSSTTFFNPEGLVFDVPGDGEGNVLPGPTRSVDGLYHPNPPQYRYGFTPGGQYVDFFNMPTICTTKPLEFQRQSISVTTDAGLSAATQQAEQALENGDHQQAQQILEAAAGG